MLLVLLVGVALGQVHVSNDMAQLVELMHLVLVRPPQSLQVRLYHCRYFSTPVSAQAKQQNQHRDSNNLLHAADRDDTLYVQHYVV